MKKGKTMMKKGKNIQEIIYNNEEIAKTFLQKLDSIEESIYGIKDGFFRMQNEHIQEIKNNNNNLLSLFSQINKLAEQLNLISKENKNLYDNINELNNSIIHALVEGKKYVEIEYNNLKSDIYGFKESLEKHENYMKEKELTLTQTGNELINELTNSFHMMESDIRNTVEYVDNTQKYIVKKIEKISDCFFSVSRTVKENNWANVFNNTITDSKWFSSISLSPGRWGAGYAFLYLLFKALEFSKPQSILELGLGETTKIILQYMQGKTGAFHHVIEQDQEWGKEFLKNNFVNNSVIKILEAKNIVSYDNTETSQYEGFSREVGQHKYDLICVDGPKAIPTQKYSRVDIALLIPSILSEDFVILFDDVNRTGERNTIEIINKILRENNIKYNSAIYRGDKDTYIIASEKYKFLASV